MSESSKLKISVWSAFVPGTALIMAATEARETEHGQTEVRELARESSGLQKEVFGWRMLEDPFGGVVDEAERERLKSALFDAMGIGVDPKKRSIAALRSFVNEANSVLASGHVEWSGSQSPTADDDDARRVNPLLALVNHLLWLIAVFEEQPHISVTVR